MALGIPGFGLDSVMSIGKTSLKNKLGQKFLGALATSPIGDYETEYKDAIQGNKADKGIVYKITKFIRNYATAWGYLAIVPGLAIKFIKNRLFPTGESKEGTMIDNIIGLVSTVLTYGGPIAALIGQLLPFQKAFALGDRKLAEMQRAEMDRETGKKIFEELDIKKAVHKPAEGLRNVLTYVRKVYADIFNRSDSNDIETAFVCGPPGTGKTAGALVILSNWARKKAERNGFDPKIKQLNLSVLEERAQKIKERSLEKAELIGSASKDLADIVKSDIGDPLMVFELLISDMENDMKENEARNQELIRDGKKPQKLAFFIDEYDKIGAMAKTTTDVNRLVRVITRLNSLITQKEVPVVITSNKTIKQIGDDLRAVIPESLWETVVEPHLQRLQTVEIYIDDPQPKEQAEIMAKYLLDIFPKEFLDIKFGADGECVPLSDNRIENVYALREPILAHISSQFGSDQLNGRFLESVVKSCYRVISSKADEIRQVAPLVGDKRLGYTDDEWDKLNGRDKAKAVISADQKNASIVKVTLPLLKKLAQSQQIERLKNKYKDDDPEFAFKHKQSLAKGIAKAFIKQKRDLLGPYVAEFLKGKIDDDSIINLISKIYSVDGGVYYSYDDVVVPVGEEEKSFKHCIKIDKATGKVQLGYVTASRDISGKQGFGALGGVELSDEMPLKEFLSEWLNEIFLIYGKPKKVNFFSAINTIRDMLKGGGQVDPQRYQSLFEDLAMSFGPA